MSNGGYWGRHGAADHRSHRGGFDTCTRVFLDDEERRRRLGSKSARVYTVAGEPNNVRVVLEFATTEQTLPHAQGLELHEAIRWATGNVPLPSFEALEHAMDADA